MVTLSLQVCTEGSAPENSGDIITLTNDTRSDVEMVKWFLKILFSIIIKSWNYQADDKVFYSFCLWNHLYSKMGMWIQAYRAIYKVEGSWIPATFIFW
jgi:hypothetical protein